MNAGDPLDTILPRLQVPLADPSAQGRALHRATIALRESDGAEYPSEPAPSLRKNRRDFALRWALPMLSVMLLAISSWLLERGHYTETVGMGPSAAVDRVLLAQVQALFGSQLNAVVERADNAPDIRLAEDSGTGREGQAQPLVVELRRGAELVRVLGFSGRTVCVQLAGKLTCFEPLASGDGGVIVTAKRFCWTPQDNTAQLSGYQVTARLLSHL